MQKNHVCMKTILHSWYIEIWSAKMFANFIRIQLMCAVIVSEHIFLFFSKKSRNRVAELCRKSTWELRNEFKKSYALASWPFIIMNTDALHDPRFDKSKIPFIRNHEKIHLKQQLDLFLLMKIYCAIEKFFLVHYIGISKNDLYLQKASEKEAYAHMYELDYLSKRRLWSMFKYTYSSKSARIYRGRVIVESDNSSTLLQKQQGVFLQSRKKLRHWFTYPKGVQLR